MWQKGHYERTSHSVASMTIWMWYTSCPATFNLKEENHANHFYVLGVTLLVWVGLAWCSVSSICLSMLSMLSRKINPILITRVTLQSITFLMFSLTGASTRRRPRGKTCCWDSGPFPSPPYPSFLFFPSTFSSLDLTLDLLLPAIFFSCYSLLLVLQSTL